MPVSRTVEGLLAELKCDNIAAEGWSFEPDDMSPPASWSNDAGDKQEGSASLKCYIAAGATHNHSAYATSPNQSMIEGGRLHVWHKHQVRNTYLEGMTRWQLQVVAPGKSTALIGPLDCGADLPWVCTRMDLPTGCLNGYAYAQVQTYNYCHYAVYQACYGEHWMDHIVISRSRYVKVTGLVSGNKVSIYRNSDNVLIGTATCGVGGTYVSIDIDTEEYPEYCYFKIYATDSITLLETTSAYLISGGDEWYWASPVGTMVVSSNVLIFNRTGAVGMPKSAAVTATLLNAGGAPVPGKTVYFDTSRGTCTPTFDVTDGNGEAHTVLTSATHGVAVVHASWPGDGDLPSQAGWLTLHCFYETEAPDATKRFQFFLEGVEYALVSGSYSLSSESTPQEFEVEIPAWLSTITRRGLVSFYRLGVKEYIGIMSKPGRSLSGNPQVVLGGTDASALLETRVVTTKSYLTKTVSYIVGDLLASYPCGITIGTIDDYSATLTMDFADETLVSSISRLLNLIGWEYEITNSYALNAKETLGTELPAVAFTEGVDLFDVKWAEDSTVLANSIRMRGAQTLVSTKFDPASVASMGLIEAPAFEKSLGTQALLDIAAEAELVRSVEAPETIRGTVKDTYAVGSWGAGDWITVTSPTLELAGTYKVVKVTRRLPDASFAEVELGSKALIEMADITDKLRRELKDLNAKTAI